MVIGKCQPTLTYLLPDYSFESVLLPPPPTKVPRIAPSLARTLVTLPSAQMLAPSKAKAPPTQMLAPSKTTPPPAAAKVPRLAPSLARSLVTPSEFPTHMLAPSKAMPRGKVPTAKVPRFAPSLARSLVTLALWLFVTQMLGPVKGNACSITAYFKAAE